MNALTRRDWMISLAGLGLAAAPAAGYFDAHVHVWSGDIEKYPLAPGFDKKDPWFPSFTVEELARIGQASGVTRFNLVQMTWYATDHHYIAEAIAKHPKRFVGTGIVPAITDVSGPSPDATMRALAKQGIVAFRIRGKTTRPPLGDAGAGERWLDHPGYEKMFQAGGDDNLALSFLLSPSDLPEVERMCTRFPRTPVIIDHFARIGAKNRFDDEEIKALCRMARHKRIYAKIGAFYALGAAKPPYLDMLPLVRRVVDAFGPERCMWESDCPMQAKSPHNYADAVALIRDHADFLSSSDKEWILGKTAERIFFRR